MYEINSDNIYAEQWFIEHRSDQRPSLIFLHDSFGCVKLWRDFPKYIGSLLKIHVLAYDRIGYGKSDPYKNKKREKNYQEKEAEFLIKVMNHFGSERAILFGHSDGATISLLAAAKYPERIAGVISEAAHVFVEDITLKGIRSAVKLYNTANLKEKLTKYHGQKTNTLFNLWADTWLSEKFRDWNMIKLLKDIICPVLVIQGEEDEYGSLKQVELIENNISGAFKKLIIPDIGHTPHKDARDNVSEKILQFFNQIL